MTPATQRKHYRYNHSAKGIARRDRYNRSAYGQAAAKRYKRKPEVQAQHRWDMRSRRLAIKLREHAL